LPSNTPTRSGRVVPGHLSEDQLLGLALGELSGEEHQIALQHLDACGRCRQAAALVMDGERTQPPEVRTEPSAEIPLEPTLVRDPLIGERLGEFVVTSKVASGGMGVIYAGIQPMLGREVAIKVLLPDLSGELQLVERLLAEGRALAAIRHPNIVDVLSYGVTPAGLHFLVMDFLKGETLSALLHRRRKLPVHDALTLLDGMLAGLDAAHRAGVLHRDLKPSNVFLSPLNDGTVHVRLLDFGLAKPMGRPGLTHAGMVLGTPGFMAPEQLLGEKLSESTDLYALGVMAYVMLTGKSPFPMSDIQALTIAHLGTPAPRLSERLPSVPPALDALVARMLEKEPPRRPRSAADVRQEFKQIRLAIAEAPTDPVSEGGTLGSKLKSSPFPAPEIDVRTTRSERPAERAMASGERKLGWRVWAFAAVVALTGFGLGILGLSLRVTADTISAQLAEARESAQSLPPEEAREALAELDGLATRLRAGETPAEVGAALRAVKASHKLGAAP
jgi:serine/threonine protein kinase